jgi:hypothetical protein
MLKTMSRCWMMIQFVLPSCTTAFRLMCRLNVKSVLGMNSGDVRSGSGQSMQKQPLYERAILSGVVVSACKSVRRFVSHRFSFHPPHPHTHTFSQFHFHSSAFYTPISNNRCCFWEGLTATICCFAATVYHYHRMIVCGGSFFSGAYATIHYQNN